MKTAHWIMFSTDRGGLVRVNVQETVGAGANKRTLPGVDVDVPLSALSDEDQSTVLEAFAALADHVGASPRDIEPITP